MTRSFKPISSGRRHQRGSDWSADVYDGQIAIGRVDRVGGQYVAITSDEQTLGWFPSMQAAVAAFGEVRS